MIKTVKGKVHSIQSLGTLDGPGVRFVVFAQGCNLRCGCCHNPDTWEMNGGTEYTAKEIVERATHYKEYFSEEGGITFSGGEPLLQSDFVREVFSLCHDRGINTCLDTSGSIMNDSVKELLAVTDRVLLDIKYTNDESYHKYVGCSLSKPLAFLEYLNEQNIPTTLRYVLIPTLNDTDESLLKLKKLADEHKCVEKIEILPFRKICQVKYDKMGLEFAFAHIPEPTPLSASHFEKLIKG
jgi:pyruvate formate lyase activating enzyme